LAGPDAPPLESQRPVTAWHDDRERFVQLLKFSPAVLYAFSMKGDYAPTFVSGSISRIFGYDPAEYLENPDFWRERVHPDDLARVEQEIAALFGNGGHSLEYRFRRKDGSYCWVSDEQHLVRDQAGEPHEIIGSWSDVTARREAEIARDAQHARLVQLLSASPAVIYSFKASGDFGPTFVSESIRAIFGYEPAEYLENPNFWSERVHPADYPRVEQEITALFGNGGHSLEYRFRRKDGSYCWVSDEQHLIKDKNGAPYEIIGSWSDVTIRKEAEIARDAQHARLAQLLTASPAVIYSFRASGDFAPTFVSENITALLGYEAKEYLENADFWRRCVHPDDLPGIEAQFEELYKNNRHSVEYRFLKKDGAYCWVSDEWRLIRSDDGEPVEVVGSWSDISSRKEAEQALQKSEQRLTDAIESTSEGFSLFDEKDRLVVCNSTFARLFQFGGGAPAPGMTYESIIRPAVDAGAIVDAKDKPDEWLATRLAKHRKPAEPFLQLRSDGRWIQVAERKTDGGGTVAVYSDLTELKQNEQRIAAANLLLTQSLRYASRIQTALLPSRRALASATADHFLIWKPRDIVGGDFFWFYPVDSGFVVMVGDCTGHGVPGAFMNLISWGLLDRVLRTTPPEKPSQILSGLHRELRTLLGQDQTESETDDGLEAGICFVDETRQQFVFAGARFSLFHARDGQVEEIKGDRAGIGYRRYATDTAFTDLPHQYSSESRFYLTTDGLIDQIGGPRSVSFGKQRFKNFIAANQRLPMSEQAQRLAEIWSDYQGQQASRDDVTVMGFKPRLA
jgi:PAS domain S-box-containing protein